MTDLVKRLRDVQENWPWCEIELEAADRIETLEAALLEEKDSAARYDCVVDVLSERIKTLEAALQSLVGCVQMVRDNAENNSHKHQHCVTYNLWSAMCKQVKIARAALEGEKKDE